MLFLGECFGGGRVMWERVFRGSWLRLLFSPSKYALTIESNIRFGRKSFGSAA